LLVFRQYSIVGIRLKPCGIIGDRIWVRRARPEKELCPFCKTVAVIASTPATTWARTTTGEAASNSGTISILAMRMASSSFGRSS
jgi:hypothetical protein